MLLETWHCVMYLYDLTQFNIIHVIPFTPVQPAYYYAISQFQSIQWCLEAVKKKFPVSVGIHALDNNNCIRNAELHKKSACRMGARCIHQYPKKGFLTR